MRSVQSLLLMMILLLLVTACTPMIYGVPQDRWDLMTEKERVAAMEAYKERQIAYQKAAAERARIRAEQEAARQARYEEQMLLRNQRVDLIYNGRTGTYGDLIRVTLSGGQIRLNGKKRGYSSVSFLIADGEIKTVPIYYSKGRKGELFVLYEGRHLWIDTDRHGEDTRRAGHLTYNRNWDSGITYSAISSHGSRDLRGVNIEIEVVPVRRSSRYSRTQPAVVIKEKIVQAPPKVIIKEKVVYKEKIVEKPDKKKGVIQEFPEEAVENIKQPEKMHRKKGIGDDNTNSQLSFEELKELREKERKEAKKVREEIQQKAQENKEAEKRAVKEKGSQNRKITEPTAAAQTATIVLNGGMLKIKGKHRPFNPVKFEITEGETLVVKLTGGEKSATQKAFSVNLMVSYVDGQIYFDGKSGDANAAKVSARKKDLKISTKGLAGLHKVGAKIDIK